jgi:hypothetical protein
MGIQMVDEFLNPLPVHQLSKLAHIFGLNIQHGMPPIKKVDNKEDGIGDEKNLLRKIQRIPQADDFLARDFCRKYIHVTQFGEDVFRYHECLLISHLQQFTLPE